MTKKQNILGKKKQINNNKYKTKQDLKDITSRLV